MPLAIVQPLKIKNLHLLRGRIGWCMSNLRIYHGIKARVATNVLKAYKEPCLSGWHTRVRKSHFAGPYTGKARRVSRRSLVMGCARKLRSDSFKGSKRHQQDRRALVCQPDKQAPNTTCPPCPLASAHKLRQARSFSAVDFLSSSVRDSPSAMRVWRAESFIG